METDGADGNEYASETVFENCQQGSCTLHPMQHIGHVSFDGHTCGIEPMENVPKTRLIRQYIRSMMSVLGDQSLANVVESLLLRDGVYCGHCFRRAGYQVIWFVEENQIKLFGPDGSLIRTASIEEITAGVMQQAA